MTPKFKGNLLIYSILFIILAIGFSDGWEIMKKETKCGVIIKKLEPSVENVHKSTSTLRIEREFVMKYDDGQIKSIKVEASTYYSYKEYDRCCFSEDIRKNIIVLFCLILSYYILGIYGIVFLIFLANKLIYPKETKFLNWFLFNF